MKGRWSVPDSRRVGGPVFLDCCARSNDSKEAPVRVRLPATAISISRHLVVTPGPKALDTIIQRCGIALNAAQVDTLWRYHRMLRRANAALNLTRIHNFENMVLKHYVDSLLVMRYIELPDTLIDMGSGPGLPGIPLKIARPGVRMILAEPRRSRVAFLREVCERLGLMGIEVYGHRTWPGLSRDGRRRDQPRSRPDTGDARPRGRVALERRQGDFHERTGLRSGSGRGGRVATLDLFRLAEDHAYTIPGTTHDRRLVVFERQESKQTAGCRRPAAFPID